MNPARGEVPQIDWPVVTIGDEALIVRWTFFAQWLLSKRNVAVKDLAPVMAAKDTRMLGLLMECFAAAVAENYTANGIPAPEADHWALTISRLGGEAVMETWRECVRSLYAAVGKARPAASPAPAKTAEQQTGTEATALAS